MGPGTSAVTKREAMVLVALLRATCALAQSAPGSPDRPWHGPAERSIQADARRHPGSGLSIDSLTPEQVKYNDDYSAGT